MNKPYYTPNDSEALGYDDSDSIQTAIELAKLCGANKIVIPRYNRRTNSTKWIITRTITLPSDITVVLDNCHLVMADGVVGNIFRNDAVKTGKAYKFGSTEKIVGYGERQKNIVIRGEGFAVLDGGKSNGILEANWEKDGKPAPKNNCLILMHGVDGFEITDVCVTNSRWWAMCIEYCTHGTISDIFVYARNTVPNQDGVHIREGCNNIVVRRIFGQSGDDFVALTALNAPELGIVEDTDEDLDMHDIAISDVVGTSVRQAVIALRCQDDHRQYNIDIENVIQSDGGDKNNFPYSAVIRIGTNGYYIYHEAPFGNRHDISVRTLVTPVHCALVFCEEIENSQFENVRQIGGWTPLYIDGVKMRNVKFKELYVSDKIEGLPIFTENGQRKDDFIDGLEIDGLRYNGEKICALEIDGSTNIIVDGKKL